VHQFAQRTPLVLYAICFGLAAWKLIAESRHLLSAELRIGPTGLGLHRGPQAIERRWEEIAAVVFYDDAGQRMLGLRAMAAGGDVTYGLQAFDARAAESALRRLAPPSLLTADADARSPSAVARARMRSEYADGRFDAVTLADPRWYSWSIGIAAVVLGAGAAYFAFENRGVVLAIPLASFALLALLGWLLIGTTIVDSEGVERRNRVGRYRISWRDVTRIAIDPNGHQVVLHAGDAQLPLVGFDWLPASAERERARTMFEAQAERRRLKVAEEFGAQFRMPRGCRVSA